MDNSTGRIRFPSPDKFCSAADTMQYHVIPIKLVPNFIVRGYPSTAKCIISMPLWGVVLTNGLGNDVPFAPWATKHFFTSLSLWGICDSCGDGRRARTALRLIWRVNAALHKSGKASKTWRNNKWAIQAHSFHNSAWLQLINKTWSEYSVELPS